MTIVPYIFGIIVLNKSMSERMCQNFLQLNTEKTEIIVFGTKEERLKVSALLDSMTLKSTNQVRNFGVVMDSDLGNFNSHIKTIIKSAYYHLKNIAIEGFLSKQDTGKPFHFQQAKLL